MTPVSRARKWLILATVAMGVFMGTLDAGTVNISLPALGKALDADAATVLWVQAVYLLVSNGLMLTMGWLGDMRGRRMMYVGGFAVFALGLALSSLSQNIYQLIACRLLQAAGQSMTVANSNAVLTSVFPSKERGKAMGMMGAVVGAGLGFGPLLGGWLIDLLGWRAIFYARIPISLIGIPLSWYVLKEELPVGRRAKLDIAGAATSFLAMGGLLLWINQAARTGWSSPGLWGIAAIAVVSGVAFVAVERRAEGPVMDLRLFRIRPFALANATHVLYFLTYSALSLLFPFYLVNGLGYSSGKAGMVFTLSPILRVGISPVAGWLSDRIGFRPLTTSGMALCAVGFFLLSRLDSASSLQEIIAFLVITSIGLALVEAPNMSAIMGSAPKERQGTASAMVAIARQGGMTLGLAAAGSLLGARQAAHTAQLTAGGADPATIPPQAMVAGYQESILFVTVPFSLITVITALATSRRKPPPD